PALVIRSGGGRSGEHFVPEGERTTIGRSPDCEIFLDDVTVSRKHAVLLRKDDAFFIEDQGSLNGTFLNRKRIESGRLENGDELQIGKYKLSFLEKWAPRSRQPRARGCSRSGRSAAAYRPSPPTSRSRRSATWRTRVCSPRGGRR